MDIFQLPNTLSQFIVFMLVQLTRVSCFLYTCASVAIAVHVFVASAVLLGTTGLVPNVLVQLIVWFPVSFTTSLSFALLPIVVSIALILSYTAFFDGAVPVTPSQPLQYAVSDTWFVSIFPLPSIEVLFTVFMLVPLTSVSCLFVAYAAYVETFPAVIPEFRASSCACVNGVSFTVY